MKNVTILFWPLKSLKTLNNLKPIVFKLYLLFSLFFFTSCSSLFQREFPEKLSENFYLYEAVKPDVSINNEIYENLLYSAKRIEEVRSFVDSPLKVISWYRTYWDNFIGGARKSAHLKGLAVDFRATKYKDQKIVFDKIANSNLKFDILIYYPKSNFIHIGFKPEKEKKYEQRLIIIN